MEISNYRTVDTYWYEYEKGGNTYRVSNFSVSDSFYPQMYKVSFEYAINNFEAKLVNTK